MTERIVVLLIGIPSQAAEADMQKKNAAMTEAMQQKDAMIERLLESNNALATKVRRHDSLSVCVWLSWLPTHVCDNNVTRSEPPMYDVVLFLSRCSSRDVRWFSELVYQDQRHPARTTSPTNGMTNSESLLQSKGCAPNET